MTSEASPVVIELPPLQADRLYSADETSAYVGAKPQWLKRALRKGEIPGGYLGRTPCWTAVDIRELIAQTGQSQKRPSRGGGPRKSGVSTARSRRLVAAK
ncbi:hypothetical protein ABZ442_05190 [Streptomyces triculaminicus]|uniref:hypothetical protein n=1 Tax=Streptomyces triculaminicus TaxID=2816232 RepID=UPI0033D350EF